MKKTIEVVAAVIKDGNKYFAAQRAIGKALGGKWEFPGGKLELNESLKEALVREIKEEFDSLIEVKDHIITTKTESDFAIIILHAFDCRLLEGELYLKEHMNSKWVNKKDLRSLDWAPADVGVIEKILES